MKPLDSMKFLQSTTSNEDNQNFAMSGLPSITDDSLTKTGDILRNDQGQYVFMCFHCGILFDDFDEIRSHCDTHFFCEPEQKFDIDLHTTESVFFDETGPDHLSSKLENDLQTTESVFFAKSGSDFEDKIQKPKIKTKPLESLIRVTTNHYKSKESLKNVKVSKVGLSQNYADPVLDVPQNCQICNLRCDNFREHLRTKHKFKGRFYQCFMCNKFFKARTILIKHMSSANHVKGKCYHCEMEPPVTNPSDARRHKCLFCKQWFPNHIEFKIHFKDAHDKDADYFFHRRSNCNIFTCYVCEREFPLRYYLAAHMKTHHEKFLRHQCPTCGRRFRTFGILTQHLKTHEDKIYPCDRCDRQFAHYVRLRNHQLSHKTELNFKCEVCSKAFKLKTYLRRHMLVHTNDKRYGCRFCSASFNFTSGRRAHEKSHHKAL